MPDASEKRWKPVPLSGDVFAFVSKLRGTSFRESLEFLAERASARRVELGAGRDVYSTDARIGVADALLGSVSVEAPLKASRALFFGGASLNFLILQLSAELGWANGFSAPPGYTGAEFDPARGSPFGSLAARLTI